MFKNLSDNLNLLMAKGRINSSELAKLTGLPATTIKRIRNNEQSNPTLSTLLPIAQHFSISISDLIGCESINHKNVATTTNTSGRSNAIPLLSWRDCTRFESLDYSSIQNKILTEKSLSEKAYSLLVEDKHLEFFPENSILIVEPSKLPESGDYIIVTKSEQGIGYIKRYIAEIDQIYLKSLVEGLSIVPLTEAYKILGVVIQYKVELKS